MKNLVLLNRGKVAPVSLTYPDLAVIDSVFDVVSDSVTCVLSSSESGIIEVQQLMKNGQTALLASFPITHAALLSFAHFVDSALLLFVFDNGDIITATYDPLNPDCDTTSVEIVGLIDAGICASSWSPDEETLAVLTKENNLILLSRLFEPICEKHLNPEDINVADLKHVSVGWGKEETQFKGKGFKALEREREALKYAGLDLKEDSPMRDPTVAEAERGVLSQFDDGTCKISWRGDCEFFAVSTSEEVESASENYARRVIRVFSREGELDSVSEAVDGIEHNLAWRPSGSLIASTQRFTDADGDEVLNVAFFERNGLRHGEFNTRLNPFEENVVNIEWSANSDIMAFHTKQCLRIWSTKNYHWYLKQEFFVNDQTPENEIAFVKFHPEKPLQMMVGTTLEGVYMLNFAHKITSGPTISGMDVGMTVVIDGQEAKVTPLAVANVPPPIAYRDYELEENILDVAVSSSNEKFAALTSRHEVHILSISLADMKAARELTWTKIDRQYVAADAELIKQVAFIDDEVIAILVDTVSGSKVVLVDVQQPDIPIGEVVLESRAVLLKSRSDFKFAVVECVDGSVFQISDSGISTFVSKFQQLCVEFEVAVANSEFEETVLAIGITANGKLLGGDQQLATAVTSLKISDSLLMFTTAHSQVCFVHLASASDPKSYEFLHQQNDSADERVRQIERGSVLVSCIPSRYSVVLQAPRGNLETICPRMMVLKGVRNFIKERNYLEAFIACRTHRIDLDLLHDYDRDLFYSNTELFVDQIKKVEYLDLFVSCLHDEDVSQTKYRDTLTESEPTTQFANLSIQQPEKPTTRRMIINKEEHVESSKVNQICNAILATLSQPKYESEYLQTRVTAFACQKPANLAGALHLISSLASENDQEQALTHLCFLLDVNKLYNHALELYDVKLALNIAQKSQKDPKEYLPFLQNLHIQPQLRKQFLIDDHLKYHDKALTWLFEIGTDAVGEFDEYVVKHELYKNALAIYKYDAERTKQVLALYADFLHEKGNFVEAGVTFEFLEDKQRALESYVSAKRWKEALSLAPAFGSDTVTTTAQKLCAILTDDHKYAEAAEIELRYLNNVEEAVRLFCKNYKFDAAILLATEKSQPELIQSVVDVQLGEGFGVIAELLADCKSQANSQLNRLRELRHKKEEDPYAFYGIPNDDLDTPDNVSVAASETSTTPSFFTKYTGKTSGTAKTGASRRTAKNRKREERKRAKGRKGTIYEEEYLIKSVGRLVERLDQTQVDALSLIEGLIRRHMIPQAYQIQTNWVELTDFLKQHIVEIHDMSERDRERIDDNGEVYLIDVIPPPTIKEFPRVAILDY